MLAKSFELKTEKEKVSWNIKKTREGARKRWLWKVVEWAEEEQFVRAKKNQYVLESQQRVGGQWHDSGSLAQHLTWVFDLIPLLHFLAYSTC